MDFLKITIEKLGEKPISLDYAILVNSFGRSGSTLLTKSIASSLMGQRSGLIGKFKTRSMIRNAWNMNSATIKKGYVYKTHDYPPKNFFTNHLRVIYLFADPLEVIFSLINIYENSKNDKWMRTHFAHLNSKYFGDFYSILDKDILGLEQHFDSWLNEKRFPVAFVRYDCLWTHQINLSNFLKIPLVLPTYKERKARKNIDPKIKRRVEHTYTNLRSKIFNCKDFFTINF